MTKVLEDDENIVNTSEEPQLAVTTATFHVKKEERSKQTTKITLPSFHDDYETVKQHKVRKWQANWFS